MSAGGTGTRHLLVRNHNFRALMVSSTFGVLGNAVAAVALPVIAAVELDASNFEVAALAGMTFLPWLLFGLAIGVWVDRLPRRPVMLASLAARVVVLALLPLGYWLGFLSTPLLFAAAFLAGIASVFFQLADAALVQQAVTPDELMEGNGLITGSGAAADAAGRSVAGWLTTMAGASNTLVVQLATSVVSLIAIQRLDVKEIVQPHTDRRILHDMWAGLRYTFSTAPLRAILLNAALWNLGGNIAASLLVLLVLRTLGESEVWLGFLLAAASAGGAVGGITAHSMGERFGSGPLWRWSMVPGVFGYASLLMLTPGWGMLWGILGMFVMGASVAWNIVVGSSFRQRVCPPGMMGRLGAASRTVSWGMLALASVLAGVLAETLGIREAVLIGVLIASLAPLVALVGPLRGVRRLEDLVEAPGPHLGTPEKGLGTSGRA
ncbi:MFS transporter [Arthrobacter sp. NamB2]|uniref:MFS transporter n=1 Tax=Arthrobacter sp. NamB2 TaxID=2576035 RepID=UPI0010C9D14C|nr:MFS transporter [Arthrobacter sp. NamB2]TKV29942.1 MFS transporter [Arthrobacter sp. NamB2]